MIGNAAGTYEIDVEDIEYGRHGGKPLLARLRQRVELERSPHRAMRAPPDPEAAQ